MAASFPTSVKNFGADHVNGEVIVPGDVNDLRAEVVAVESLKAYLITPSIVTNNLKLEIKARSGGDPSATEPVSFVIAGAGRKLTAALSVTVNAGTSIFNAGAVELAAKSIDLFVYMGWRAASSTLFVLVSRIPFATTYADFSVTSTNEKYGAYSGGAPASTDVVQVIGRFAAQNSGSASYNWSIPTPFVVNEPIFETRWLDYTPQWSTTGAAPTPGNGTLTGEYLLDGRLLIWKVKHTWGNTTGGGTGVFLYSGPFSPTDTASFSEPTAATLNDSSSRQYIAQVGKYSTPGKIYLQTDTSGNGVTTTSDFTWATGDQVLATMIWKM